MIAATALAAMTIAPVANAVSDPGFESGGFSTWSQCGGVRSAKISAERSHSGTYSALNGSTSPPEVNGTDGVCQTVTIPANARLAFYVYEGTNDTIQYANQQAALWTTDGASVVTLYAEASNAKAWEQKSFDLSPYAGQTLTLFIGVSGNGWKSGYIYQYVDDVSLTSGGPTPHQGGAYTCDNQQFLSDQSEFASGTITADQFVDICGVVTRVLPAKTTRSGRHGYFYVEMPSGYHVEIVSNLDAMQSAPPAWPWVAVGDYVYVQGRYYYDNSYHQGVDWTEGDTGRSWPHTGYVAVCNASGQSCSKYQ